MTRVFIALHLPEETVDDLVDLQSGVEGARWVDHENFHLTLAFIGEVDRHRLDELHGALGAVVAPAFTLQLSGCGFFGDRKPHALWAGVVPAPALERLHAKVEQAARRAGAEPERRRFIPHVTLAYLKGALLPDVLRWTAAHGLFAPAPFTVDSFHLVASYLGAGGAHYETIASYPLSFSR